MLVRSGSTLCPYLFKAFYDWLIDSHVTPHLLVKIKTPGVRVPKQFQKDEFIVLSIAPLAVKNFQIGPRALTFNTRFSGIDEYIVIPYKAMGELIAYEDQIAFPINVWMQQDVNPNEPDDGFDDDQESDVVFNTLESTTDSSTDNNTVDFNPQKDTDFKDEVPSLKPKEPLAEESDDNKDDSQDSDDDVLFTVVDIDKK